MGVELKVCHALESSAEAGLERTHLYPRHAVTKGIVVRNYDTLNDHPELILYKCWYTKLSRKFEIKPQ